MIIVHIITRLIRGGADENTLLSCNAQADFGHSVHLIVGQQVSQDMLSRVDERVTVHQIKSLVRPLSPIQDIRAVIAIASVLKSLSPDVVHTHTSKAGIIGRCAALWVQPKGIVHGVHILPFLNVGPVERAVYLAAEKLISYTTDAFVDVSEGMRSACLEHGIGRDENHFVVPSGMDIRSFLDAKPVGDVEMSELLGFKIDPEIRIVLMVAALEPRKRIVEFLNVFASSIKSDSRIHFIVLGEGFDRTRIASKIKELGLDGRVHLAGFRTDVERWIARADVCVLSSEREGLPRAVVQYVAGGKPCVIAHLPGVEVVVRNGVNGYVVANDQLTLMPNLIQNILNNESLAESMTNEARQLDLLPWSVDNMAAQLEMIYKQVVS